MFLLVAAAGVTGIGTLRAAVGWFHDPVLWQWFVTDVDDFVPAGWTRLAECRPSERRLSAAAKPVASAQLAVVKGGRENVSAGAEEREPCNQRCSPPSITTWPTGN